MNTLTYSAFKSNVDSALHSVVETHTPVTIGKNRKSSVVVLPLEEYLALTETKYLLSSPANAVRLMQGIEEVEALIAKAVSYTHLTLPTKRIV